VDRQAIFARDQDEGGRDICVWMKQGQIQLEVSEAEAKITKHSPGVQKKRSEVREIGKVEQKALISRST